MGARLEAGQAMVEAALVLPVLLLAAVGLLQFAVYVHAQEVVTAAVQEGARSAAALGGTPQGGLATAQALLGAGLSGTPVVVTLSETSQDVTVSATGQLPLALPWVTRVTVPLGATTTMQREAFDASAP